MLTINIPKGEYYDYLKEVFVTTPEVHLKLQHSLVSISKWESRWCKPFVGKSEKSEAETYDYIRCMIVDDCVVDDMTIKNISQETLREITDYINAPMTATTIAESKSTSREIVTSELIYYWMIALNIPFECQSWHLNRLLTLINVCNIKNAPPKKTSKRDVMSRNTALNAARKKAMNTSG